MIKLMSHVHEFVPVIETNQQVDISDERTVTKPISTLHPLLFGGDQPIAACIRDAQEGSTIPLQHPTGLKD